MEVGPLFRVVWLLGQDWDTTSLPGVSVLVLEGHLPLTATKSLRWVLVEGQIQNLIGSSCHSMAAPRRHITAIILLVDQNMRSVSVYEICSTPFGHAWPKPMHKFTKSSSWKEL